MNKVLKYAGSLLFGALMLTACSPDSYDGPDLGAIPVAANYAELKLRLAEAFPDDRNMYRTLKGLYIDSILDVWRESKAAEGQSGET